MGRGLSTQQRRILGLGRAFNIAMSGEPHFPELTVAEPGDPASVWNIPAVVAPDGMPEIRSAFCLLVLDGMKLAREHHRRGYWRKVAGSSPVWIGDTTIRFGWNWRDNCRREREYFDNSQPGFASRKASLIRALDGLLKRRLLVYQPDETAVRLWPAPNGVGFAWRTNPEGTADSGGAWGYRLTPEGAEAGEGHEPDMPAVELLKARRRLLWQYQPVAIARLDARVAALEQQAA